MRKVELLSKSESDSDTIGFCVAHYTFCSVMCESPKWNQMKKETLRTFCILVALSFIFNLSNLPVRQLLIVWP